MKLITIFVVTIATCAISYLIYSKINPANEYAAISEEWIRDNFTETSCPDVELEDWYYSDEHLEDIKETYHPEYAEVNYTTVTGAINITQTERKTYSDLLNPSQKVEKHFSVGGNAKCHVHRVTVKAIDISPRGSQATIEYTAISSMDIGRNNKTFNLNSNATCEVKIVQGEMAPLLTSSLCNTATRISLK